MDGHDWRGCVRNGPPARCRCRCCTEGQKKHGAKFCKAMQSGLPRRKKIIETEILSQYDLSSYQEYLDLKPTGVTLFDAITKEIRAAEENWYLLFCGFDDDGEAHIFVI